MPPALFSTAVAHNHIGDAEQPGGHSRVAVKGGQPRAGDGEDLMNRILKVKCGPTQTRYPASNQLHVHPIEVVCVESGLGIRHDVLSSDGP